MAPHVGITGSEIPDRWTQATGLSGLKRPAFARIYDALNTLGISKYFRSIYSGLETGHPKPDPYIYTLGIEDAGCLPSQAMVIEDSRTGIEGAKASGTFVTALRDPDGIADQSFADAIVTDLRDVIPLLRQ